jgi:RNA polymerase sigma-70 factor (ECF subfamily)
MGSTATDLESPSKRDCPSASRPKAFNWDGPLEKLYAEHASLVWRGLRRLGVPDSQLEDAVQDVFLVAHRRFGEFEGRSALKTWIYGIAVRVAKDFRRAEVRYARRLDRLAECLVSEQALASSPADATERREASQLLHAILAALPDETREVLVLVELEDLTAREASEALGIRLRTCQRRLRAGVQALSAGVADYLQGDWRRKQ